jgi:hypothetical protein
MISMTVITTVIQSMDLKSSSSEVESYPLRISKIFEDGGIALARQPFVALWNFVMVFPSIFGSF